MLFDRICRENGIKHLLTAPRSPTTTGKVERFHKTVRKEFLAGRIFASLEEAQAELDAWVAFYNTERPHQGIGMVPPGHALRSGRLGGLPAGRSRGARAERYRSSRDARRRVQRNVSGNGRIRLAGLSITWGGSWPVRLVEAEIGEDGLISIYHRDVLVATLARRHPIEREAAALRQAAPGTGSTAKTVGKPVSARSTPGGASASPAPSIGWGIPSP